MQAEIKRLISAGKVLWEEGLVTSHGGNLSCRYKDGIIITKTGTRLGFLEEKDFTIVPINSNPQEHPEASSELVVHLEIYKKTEAQAVIHAHPPFTVALSLQINEIVPLDTEGLLTFKRCPVIEVEEASASFELAQKTASHMEHYEIICVKGHGTFSAARDVEKALFLTSAVEFASKILLLNQVIKALL